MLIDLSLFRFWFFLWALIYLHPQMIPHPKWFHKSQPRILGSISPIPAQFFGWKRWTDCIIQQESGSIENKPLSLVWPSCHTGPLFLNLLLRQLEPVPTLLAFGGFTEETSGYGLLEPQVEFFVFIRHFGIEIPWISAWTASLSFF